MQLDLMQKMVPIKVESKLIECRSEYGPVFGEGNDLFIGDYCNYGNAYAKFPTSYNIEGAPKYTRGQESFKAFSGAVIGCNFKVVDYEVYKVVY